MTRKITARRMTTYGQYQLQEAVNPVFQTVDAFTGVKLPVLLDAIKQSGYDIGCHCDYAPHELDLFRRKLAVPYIKVQGRKARLYFPVNRGYWVSLFRAMREAVRDPETSDASQRMQKFEQLLAIAQGRELPMFFGLDRNRTVRDLIRTDAERHILYEQVALPGFDKPAQQQAS